MRISPSTNLGIYPCVHIYSICSQDEYVVVTYVLSSRVHFSPTFNSANGHCRETLNALALVYLSVLKAASKRVQTVSSAL